MIVDEWTELLNTSNWPDAIGLSVASFPGVDDQYILIRFYFLVFYLLEHENFALRPPKLKWHPL